ncbi:MAG: hypothetical protein M1372_02725, partial [Patescibacteria group bacterium]|nr:hypothetical protein [Patescibacteria group bacterium]
TNWFTQSLGTLHPINSTLDLLIGGTSTSSAKFAVLNVNSGTPTASISAGTTGGAYLTAGGTLQTTANQTLTIGGNTTGELILQSRGVTVFSNPTSGVGQSTFVGEGSGASASLGSGVFATALGYQALNALTTGSGNTAVGYQALISNTTGAQNTAVGYSALFANTANANTAVGYSALSANTTGIQNAALGTSALTANTTANANTAVGYSALSANTKGASNTAVGNSALLSNTTGSLNTALGSRAGYTTVAGNANTIGTNNTFLGSNSGPGGTNWLTNAAAIGNLATVTCPNCLVLGSIEGINTATASARVGIGVASPIAVLDVEGAFGGNAALIVNQTGVSTNDILTASASGTTRLTLSNGGNLNLIGGVYQSGGVSGVAVASASCVTATGGIVTGSTACDLGNSGWSQSSGLLYPNNSTLDLAIGGTSTSSAKFAFLNVNSGTPTASISASSGNNAVYLTGDGTLATTNRRTITIGNSSTYNTTGNILLNPNGTGNVGVGTTSPLTPLHIAFNNTTAGVRGLRIQNTNSTIAGGLVEIQLYTDQWDGVTPREEARIVASMDGSSSSQGYLAFSTRKSNAITEQMRIDSQGNVGIGTTTPTALLDVVGAASVGGQLTFRSGSGTLQTTANQTLTIGGNTTGNIILNPLNGAAGGNVTIQGTTTLNSVKYTWPSADGTSGFALTTSGTGTLSWTNPSSLGTNYWTLNSNGTLYPINSTLDLLIGGTSTSSAKFAVLNVNSGTPTASISAGTTGGAYLTAAGTLQTTANQTLTIGGNTTGELILQSRGATVFKNPTAGANQSLFIGEGAGASITGGSLSSVGIGYQALFSNTTGTGNTAVGYTALFANSTGINNTAVGADALLFNTGSSNTAVGTNALLFNTGSNNTAVGLQALSANTTGTDSTALGYQALLSNTASSITAVGSQALRLNTTGAGNTALGASALSANTTGSWNTAVGTSALSVNTTGAGNTALGYQALLSNTASNLTAVGNSALLLNTSGANNTALGASALRSNTTGGGNTVLGFQALYSNATGTNNSALGNGAGFINSGQYSNATGDNNVYLGYNAGPWTQSASFNNTTAIGAYALVNASNSLVLGGTGFYAVSVGIGTATPSAVLDIQGGNKGGNAALIVNQTGASTNDILTASASGVTKFILTNAGNASASAGFTIDGAGNLQTTNENTLTIGGNTTGELILQSRGVTVFSNPTSGVGQSTFVGEGSGASASLGSAVYNTALGYQTLNSNTSGNRNAALGYQALLSNTTGARNTAVGFQALSTVTTGNLNTALGYQALFTNTGSNNTAIGGTALTANTIGASNTAVGNTALSANTTGANNVAVGTALTANTTGASNTAVGNGALSGNTIGASNTAVGNTALSANTTGIQNTALGFRAGYTSVSGNANTIGTNNTFLGYNSGPGSTNWLTNAAAIGSYATVTCPNCLTLGSIEGINTATASANVGIGVANPIAVLDVEGDFGGNAALIVNQTGASTNDIFTASASGTTKFTINNKGFIGIIDGTASTAVGYQALNVNTGVWNTALGYQALLSNTGASNTAVGLQALLSNTTGNGNIAMGLQALLANTTGFTNTAVGNAGLSANTTGSNNTALGFQAGYTTVAGNANIIGTNNTFLGYSSGPGSTNWLTNAAAIGNLATVTCPNCLTLGSIEGINTATASARVGIGIASPQAVLDVEGAFGGNAALIVNQKGASTNDIFTASASGTTRLRIANDGSTLFQGSVLASIGNGGSGTGSDAVINAIGDQGSMIPNAGFEANYGFKSFSDGWVKDATSSATVTRDTSVQAKGTASAKIQLTNTTAAIYSACIPLSGSVGSYTLNYYAQATAPIPTLRAHIDQYTSKANCQSNTSVVTSAPAQGTAITTSWATYGSSTTAIALSSNTLWGRVHFFIGCTTNCTNSIVNIDGVRLTESTTGQGLDYAENYPADPNHIPGPGDVVSFNKNNGIAQVAPTEKYMDQGALGVISTKPGYVLDDAQVPEPKVSVALAGRVPVKVSSKNGEIRIGDYLASSDIPGVAVRAITAGSIIGTAMEDYTDPDTTHTGKVTMFIKNTYLPVAPIILAANGTVTSNAPISTQAAAMSLGLSGVPQAPTINPSTGSGLSAGSASPSASFNLAGDQNFIDLKSRVASAEAQIADLRSMIINSSTQSAFFNSVTNSAVLGASTSAGFTSNLADINAQTATISGTLMVLGRTTLADLGVTGNIAAGLLSVHGLDASLNNGSGGASINSIGDLNLQSNGLGGLNILNGKVIVDTKGNIKTTGEITTAKVNIDTSVASAATLGSGVLKAGTTSVVISTTAVTSKSKIFVTATSKTGGQALIVTGKSAGTGFTVEAEQPYVQDIKFDWWIVDER